MLQEHQGQAAASRGAAQGHAGITAQSYHAGHVLFVQESPGGKVAGHVLHDKRQRLARLPRQRPAGQRQIIEAGGVHQITFQPSARAGERDPHSGPVGRQLLRNGQPGKKVSGGAASGEYDVLRAFHKGMTLILRHAVPSKAQSAAAIQKRTTILLSGQPRNWK